METDAADVITVVSGLPRSGTSMMMKMLEAGGLPVLTDKQRAADEDNPRGYYEYEPVKALETDQAWLPAARGKVVKIISALLRHLPQDERYRVVFMRRDIDEVLASQRQMLIRRGRPADRTADAKMAELFERHLADVQRRLDSSDAFAVLYLSYDEVLGEPGRCVARINEFLGGGLDEAGMALAIEPALHRQRGGR